MNACVNLEGQTFTVWTQAAGYSVSWLARCSMQFFAMLHKGWRNNDPPDKWAGRGKDQPWD